jgi:hypothetical protein
MELERRPTSDCGPVERPKKADRKRKLTAAKVRSALSNGSSLIVGVDHRSGWMRRLRDLIVAHENDLGDAISEGERRLVQRAAMLTLQLEMMEQRWAVNDGEASAKALDAYQRTCGALRRILETLGLSRRAKDITPSLSEYLDQHSREVSE